MNPFSPARFFDLDAFSHKALFNECTFVWEALRNLPFYFEELDLGKINGHISSQAMIMHGDKVFVGKGTRVDPFAMIEGPVWIGEDCQIRHGALIRPYSIIGNGSVVGHGSEVKCSVMMENSAAPHLNFVGDSVVGSGVNIGAGAKCGNLRLDGKEVVLRHDGQVYHTGLRKFGAIMGDGVKLGCNVVTNPGAILRKNFFAKPNSTISGVFSRELEARDFGNSSAPSSQDPK